MSQMATGFRFDPEWRITLFTVVLIPLMVGLGFWQLQRAEEKAALSASWEQRQAEGPVALSELWSEPPGSLAYRPVKLSGTFLQDQYFLLDNKIHGGRFGYEVVAILQLSGNGGTVLVNRGWIAGDPARLELPQVPVVAGQAELTGHVYVAPGAPYLLAEQQLQSGWPKRIQALEMDKLAAPVNNASGGKLFPYPIRIDAGRPGALLVDWKVVNISPQKHQGYAVQWFSMATVLFIFYLLRCSNLFQLITGSGRIRD
jgi:surfeit locus 1 family protein